MTFKYSQLADCLLNLTANNLETFFNTLDEQEIVMEINHTNCTNNTDLEIHDFLTRFVTLSCLTYRKLKLYIAYVHLLENHYQFFTDKLIELSHILIFKIFR